MRIPLLAVGVSVAFTVASPAASPLAEQPSAFLRAHADSPVRWMTWGDASFARAKSEDKPVFVVIGAFTSELSRAMRQQSFARPEIAETLNQNFVCVLVDRDERPDVAALYQTYVRVVKQAQGWPLNIWLTPELKPFEGATYLPPSDEWGKEGFANALKRVGAAWQADPAAQRHAADEAVASVVAAAPTAPVAVERAALSEILATGAAAWRSTFDAVHGGFGEPPKYPEPELLRFLLRGDDANRQPAQATLRAMAGGAVRDPLDGGFFRYASDAEWKLPYFQKTLGDQTRLALALLDAAKHGDDPRLHTAARDALGYALSLGDPAHGFAAADDGTPENVQPSVLWTEAEIRAALGDAATAEFSAAFGVSPAGNLAADAITGVETTGKNILFRTTPPGGAELEMRLAKAADQLLQLRRKRPAPLRDSAATSGAHGQLLAALARAGAELSDERCTTAARGVFGFIRDQLRTPDGTLRAIAGRPTAASPRDYAFVIDGIATYAAATKDATARELAVAFLEKLRATCWDAKSGRFLASGEPAAPGFWARVSEPAPDAGAPPAAETALLVALVAHHLGDDGIKAALAAAIAADVNDAATPARGDQLLALQMFMDGR